MLTYEQTRASKLAGVFLLLGALWIIVTDSIVEHRTIIPQGVPTVQTWKGWVFVFLAALFIFVVVERELRRRRKAERLAAFRAGVLDEVGQAVIATDPEGYILYWNPAAERLFGWRTDEVLGRDVLSVTAAPAARAGGGSRLDELRRSGEWRGDFLLRRRDGSTFHGVVTNAALHDSAGQVAGYVSVTTDISDRVRLEEELRQSQKLEAIGRLAGGVAHDFNNILTVISGHAELLVTELNGTGTHSNSATEIREAAARATELTRQLLAFSRKQVLRPTVLDVNEVVAQAESMLTRLIGEQFQLLLQLDAAPCYVRADRTQLEQVLMNLVVNSRDAMPERGQITIRTACESSPAADDGAGRSHGEYVRLDVADNGVGIEQDAIEHIFEPFFTTKPAGQGTGLGLSMVYGVVQQSGGTIRVESRPGAGTTMQILLPRVPAERPLVPQPEPRMRTQPEPLDGAARGEVVLVVEDDEAVRGLVVRILSRRGYEVIQTATPAEALQLIDRKVAFDLLVTDVVMPGMSGVELGTRMRTARPELAVLCMSGYTASTMPRTLSIGDAGPNLLEKPFSSDDLAAAVRAALDARNPA